MGLKAGARVAAVGGGGKTSLLTALARRFHARGSGPALLTTTTRVFAPQPGENLGLVLGDVDTVARNLGSCLDAWGVSWCARRREGAAPLPGAPGETRMKLAGFAPAEIARLALPRGLTLIEADGARRLPIKAPGENEPVLPEKLDAVLGVVGLDALGTPADEAHVFRPARLRAICGITANESITPAALARLCAHPEGLFKNAGTARKWIVLNKTDLAGALDFLEKIAYVVWERAGKPRGPADGILLTSCANGDCVVRLCVAAGE